MELIIRRSRHGLETTTLQDSPVANAERTTLVKSFAG